MNTNHAFKLAANRVEKYLAEVGVEINPKQAFAVVCQYAGHGPWAAVNFKKAARSVEKQLEALGVGQLHHTLALELVARIESVKSWNVLQKHLAPNPTSGTDAEAQSERALALVTWAALAAVQDAPVGFGEQAQATEVRAAAVYKTLQALESEIGSSTQCVNVEYDVEFCGGSYSGVGSFIAVPLVLVDLSKGSVEPAFTLLTGLHAQHIVHYTLDEVVNQVGDPFEELEDRAPLDSEADSLPLMWIRKDRPLSEAELQAHTGDGERYAKVVLDVNWDLLGDIDALNDEVSERITGASCGLEDIGYQNHFPTDKERQQFGEPEPHTIWIEVTANWSPCD